MLYEFVFASRDGYEPFAIFKSFPREHVPCSGSLTIGEADIEVQLMVETDVPGSSVDPIVLVEECAQVRQQEEKCRVNGFR